MSQKIRKNLKTANLNWKFAGSGKKKGVSNKKELMRLIR